MPGCDKYQYSKVEAQTQLNRLLKKGTFKHGFGRIYPCNNCGFWHLTSEPLQNKKEQSVFLKYISDWKKLMNGI
jgi:hypothetical protein